MKNKFFRRLGRGLFAILVLILFVLNLKIVANALTIVYSVTDNSTTGSAQGLTYNNSNYIDWDVNAKLASDPNVTFSTTVRVAHTHHTFLPISHKDSATITSQPPSGIRVYVQIKDSLYHHAAYTSEVLGGGMGSTSTTAEIDHHVDCILVAVFGQ